MKNRKVHSSFQGNPGAHRGGIEPDMSSSLKGNHGLLIRGGCHKPVLVNEVLKYLIPKAHLKDALTIIDATVGTGGHAVELVKKGHFMLGIDADKKMLEIAKKNLGKACPVPVLHRDQYFKLVHGNFKDIDAIVEEERITRVDGILIDLGISSFHFDSPSRGFSFKAADAPLDMRLDKDNQALTAADLLNSLRKDQLIGLFREALDFQLARKISARVVKRRENIKFKTVGDLLTILPRVNLGTSRIHFATKAFMALRMAVNSEIENLKTVLPRALSVLAKGGKLAVISFHSGEDAIVKEFIRKTTRKNLAKALTKKPITPSEKEVARNARSRSAKMRIIEKT